MRHNRELVFLDIVGSPEKTAAAVNIGGRRFHSAIVSADDGEAVVEVFEGCGDEVYRFPSRKMPGLVIDWIARADAGDHQARDLLHEVATEGLKFIRELRAEPLMLKPTTATMIVSEGGRHRESGLWFGPSWKARLDADETVQILGPVQNREDCIADLHRAAGCNGYIVTRIYELEYPMNLGTWPSGRWSADLGKSVMESAR